MKNTTLNNAADQAINRYQLSWLLVSLAIIVVTHLLNIPIWLLIVSFSLIVYRLFATLSHWPLPSRWKLVALTLFICICLALSFKSLVGRDVSLSLLLAMVSLKLLETQTKRDFILVVMFSYFLVGCLFLFNQSIFTFAISIPPLILLTATLICISSQSKFSIKFMLSLAGKMLLQAVPVMIILFILFPRLPGPLWAVPKDSHSGMTGLNDSLQFGNISQLARNSSVAFRATFNGKPPARKTLYWRGPVLWQQKGNNWLSIKNNPKRRNEKLTRESLTTQGTAINYTITLEPHNRQWMLLLDMPTKVPSKATLTHDYSAISATPIHQRIRYSATSFSQFNLGKTLSAFERQAGLKIGNNENAQTKALTASWSTLAPEAKINKALRMFNQQPFVYTLSPPRLESGLGSNAIDQFLFDTQRGFCEHYATSFVYLMRASGIPSRIVTGYQGGELNPNGNYLIVRQSDAHAWAEVWLKNRGWVRVDPTAAVSPDRIELGIGESVANAYLLPMLSRKDFPWLHKAALNWDNINNGWNQWVLGYDDKTQLSFLEKLTGQKLSSSQLAVWMTIIASIVSTITGFWLIKFQKQSLNPVQKIYAKHLRQLKKLNIVSAHSETATDIAARAAKQHPEMQNQLKQIAHTYNLLQYSQHEADLESFRQLILQFKTM